jgi:predicted DCC family thiol-disulfide oxidoreductase YuxK
MTTIYYDGLCYLCSREIDHYRKQSGSDALRFLDITAPDFDANAEGVDPVQVHKVMHVRRQDGTLATGVNAFIEIWKVLPKYNWAARLAVRSLPNLVLNVGYQAFATIRPFLPRKKGDCAASPYCETK